jgi:hypothetical protein
MMFTGLSRDIEKMNKKEVKPEKGEPSASEELAKRLKASIKKARQKYPEEFGGYESGDSNSGDTDETFSAMISELSAPNDCLFQLSPSLETIPFWPSKQYPKTLDSPGQQWDSIQALGQESLSDKPLYTLEISRLLIPKLLPRTSCLDQHLQIGTQAHPENPNPPTKKTIQRPPAAYRRSKCC